MFPLSKIEQRQQDIALMKAEGAWVMRTYKKIRKIKKQLTSGQRKWADLESLRATLNYLQTAPRTPGTNRDRYAVIRAMMTGWLRGAGPVASASDDVLEASDEEMTSQEDAVPVPAKGKAKERRPRKKPKRT